MRRTTTLAMAAALLGVGACTDEPTGIAAAITEVRAVAGCGPADGPSVTFIFSHKSLTPNTLADSKVYLNVYRSRTDLAGRVYRFEGANDIGYAGSYLPSGEYSTNVTGRLRVDRVTADGNILAHADLRLPDGSHLRRAFVATLVELDVLCG